VSAVLRRVLPPVLFAAGVLAAWQALCALTGVAESTLPAPSDIARALWDERSLLADNAWPTLVEILLGFALATVVGVGLALALHLSPALERAAYPWLVASQMIPIVAIAPVVVLWTGFDLRPKVIVIALVSFFPIVVSTVDGLRSAPPGAVDVLRTLGAPRWRVLLLAELPAALPFTFSGLRVAAALSVIGAVFAEWVGSSEGLGYLVLVLNNQVRTAEVFAVVVVLAVIGLALFGAVSLAERLALPWYHGTRRVSRP
jgi:ABC-type nitrate/sulfonate/bicarbonate transport system permease component